jgi:hypothetical protein
MSMLGLPALTYAYVTDQSTGGNIQRQRPTRRIPSYGRCVQESVRRDARSGSKHPRTEDVRGSRCHIHAKSQEGASSQSPEFLEW